MKAYNKINLAINGLLADRSLSTDEVLDVIEEIREHVETWIDILKRDLQYESEVTMPRDDSTEGLRCEKCGRAACLVHSCEPCPFCEAERLRGVIREFPIKEIGEISDAKNRRITFLKGEVERLRGELDGVRKMACDSCSSDIPLHSDGYHESDGSLQWCDARFDEEPEPKEGE